MLLGASFAKVPSGSDRLRPVITIADLPAGIVFASAAAISKPADDSEARVGITASGRSLFTSKCSRTLGADLLLESFLFESCRAGRPLVLVAKSDRLGDSVLVVQHCWQELLIPSQIPSCRGSKMM
jgi:hypothetical protein